VIPAAFGYSRPASVAEAIGILAGDPEAKLLAGGHSLIPLLKLRLAEPSQLVDIGRIPGLSYINEGGDYIAVGAMTTHFQIETSDLLRRLVPLLPDTVKNIGDVQVRNRGTIGGSLAHADPAADLGAAALALDARLVLQGPGGSREIGASEFFVDMLTTALEPGEVLTEVRFPRPSGSVGAHYLKFNKRAIDWAIVGVAAHLVFDGEVVTNVAIGLTALGSTPLRATLVEEALRGRKWSADLVRQASLLASEGLDPPSDHNGSTAYRLHLSRILTARALEQAGLNAAR
jgi:aerobic carbon-monoxide dehydrogenase medium subunit